eukprot:scaffold23565_cov71-Phaeocystis_antarctica.AAC.11
MIGCAIASAARLSPAPWAPMSSVQPETSRSCCAKLKPPWWKRSPCICTQGGALACSSASMPLWLRTTRFAAQLALWRAPGFLPCLVVLSDRNIQHHVCGGGAGDSDSDGGRRRSGGAGSGGPLSSMAKAVRALCAKPCMMGAKQPLPAIADGARRRFEYPVEVGAVGGEERAEKGVACCVLPLVVDDTRHADGHAAREHRGQHGCEQCILGERLVWRLDHHQRRLLARGRWRLARLRDAHVPHQPADHGRVARWQRREPRCSGAASPQAEAGLAGAVRAMLAGADHAVA